MQLRQEVKHRLRSTRPFAAIIEEIEREVERVEERDARAAALYELGEVCEDFFLRKDRAMVHYQASFKLSSQDPRALARARQIYREMGNLDMVATLLGLELKSTQDSVRRAQLQIELGVAQLDLGKLDKAVANLTAALQTQPDEPVALEAYAAATHDPATWQEALTELTDQALADPTNATELFLRIARILKIEAPGDPRIEEALRACLAYNIHNEEANFLLEGLLGGAGRVDDLTQLHLDRAQACEDDFLRTEILRSFAVTWALRFGDTERAAYFYQQALLVAYGSQVEKFVGHLAAFVYLAEVLAPRGEWQPLFELADLGLQSNLSDEDRVLLAVQAGIIGWTGLQDLETAERYFGVVAELDPDNEALQEFLAANSGEPGEAAPSDQGGGYPAEEAVGQSAEFAAPSHATASVEEAEAEVTFDGSEPDAVGPEARPGEGASVGLVAGDEAAGLSHADTEQHAKHHELAAEAKSVVVPPHLEAQAAAVPPAASLPASFGLPVGAPLTPIVPPQFPSSSSDIAAGSTVAHLVGSSETQPVSVAPSPAVSPSLPAPVVESPRPVVKVPPADFPAVSAAHAMPAMSPPIGAKNYEAAALAAGPSAETAPVEATPVATSSAAVTPPSPTHAPSPGVAGSDPFQDLSAQEELPDAVRQAIDAARAVEAAGPVDKAIEAWKKLSIANPTLKTPRAHHARVLRGAEKWTLLVEVLKEEAEKLPQYSPDEKVAAFFALADIYKEKLRQDVPAVGALTAVLTHQPGNRRALDALALQYEHMKRWPDLISTLQKKAGATDDRAEQVALHGRVASLFQDKFSNAAEAIKAYEKVIELDPHNEAAITFLKANYEKRRDWEKLIAVYQREIELVADHNERSRKFIEVAKLASEKLKKPQISIDLWAKVLEAAPDHAEALAELEKLYEREKLWDKLADVLERQAVAATDPTKKSAVLLKLGVLFTDRVNDPTRAIAAWQSLLGVEADNKRAQDALKKLYTAQKRWSDLETFYAAQNKYDEFIRVLERQAETEDDATKIVLNNRIAELYRDRLQKPDRAMRAYEKVLALDAKNRPAAEALIPLYEGAKDSRRLSGVLEIQLGYTPAEDVASRLDQMRRLADLFETQLRDKAAAYSWVLRAFGEAPEEEWTRIDSERLASETGGWAQLVEAYEEAVKKLPAEPALPLLMVVARVYEGELGNVEKALETNRKILLVDENSASSLEALERLYLATGKWHELLGVYEKKLELESDAGAQKEIRYRIAALFDEEIKEPSHAIDAYKAILQQFGDELPALGALDRIYEATARWADLEATLMRELELVGDEDAHSTISLKYRLGALRESHRGDPAGAIACYRDILELDQSNEEARTALERLLAEPARAEHKLAVAGILEPIYEHLGQWAKLVDVHEIQHAAAHASNASTETRVGLLLRIGELHATHLEDAAKSFDAYSRAFKEDPSNPTAREQLEALADGLGAWQPLVQLYQSALDDPTRRIEPTLFRELLLGIAGAFDEKLGQSDRAVEYFRRAQAIEPNDTTALDALEKLYTRQEKWNELLDTYRKKVELTTDREEREAIYFRMAYLWEEMLGNLDEAVATYKEVLGQDDGNINALKALDRLYNARHSWHELADNLQRQLALTEDQDETVGLLLRLADLREHQLGEVSASVDTYRQVLELDGHNEQAVTSLERLVVMPDHELVVASILESIYRGRDDWKKLISVYEIMVKHAAEPARKIELLHGIGELYEVGDDSDSAFTTYSRAFREEPGLEETLQRLERLSRTFDRWKDLVALFKDVLNKQEHPLDPDLQVALWTRVAQIEEAHLASESEAAAAYLKVLAIDSHNLAAADALEAIYLRTDSYTQLVEIVLHKVDMVSDVAEKKQLGFKAAQIFEEVLEDPEKAIGVFRQVLAIDENDPTAIEALERLYIKLEQWENLKDIYAKKAELAASVDEKKQMFFVLGQVYDRELKDKSRAIETYQHVLDLDPDDLQAVQALDRLYGETGRWYELLQILEREVELTQSSEETVTLKHRIGQLWQTQLKDLTRSVEAYRETLALDPGHAATLTALNGLVHGDQDPVLAASVLEPIFESAAEWDQLIDVLEVMVKHAEDPYRRVELLHRIADLHERQMLRHPSAFAAFGRALREDSANEHSLAHIERLAGVTGSWAELASLYEEETKKLSDPPRQVDMLLRTARVYEEEIGSVEGEAGDQGIDKAIETYRRVLEVEPDQTVAILALDRLYQATGRWTDLADILRHEARLAESGEDIINIQFRLGQLYETELKDVDKAIEVYREILAADPNHGPTLTSLELLFADGTRPVEIAAILEPLYTASEQWEKLIQIQVAHLERVTDSAERQQMLQRIAELCEQKLPEDVGQEHAFGYWAQALREAPASEFAGEEVERLARAVGQWEALVGLYSEILEGLGEQKPGNHTAKIILTRLARVYEEELHDAAHAEDANLHVLGIDDKDASALAALDRIYEQASMAAELAGVLVRRIGITPDTEELIQLHSRLGGVYAGPLGDMPNAIASYNAILELDTRHRPSLEALEQIYSRQESWPELYGTYEKLVDVAHGDEEMAEFYSRMARIAEPAFAETQGAKVARDKSIDLWQRVIDVRGEDAGALASLADLHQQAESWQDLVGVIERRIAISPSGDEQIDLYTSLAHIWREKLQRDSEALDAWRQVLAIDPGHVDALRAMATIHQGNQSWDDLVEVIHRLLELDSIPIDEQRELYAQLGQIQGELLMRPQEAIDAWRRVVDFSPRDFRALAALETLFTQEARWEECVEILEKKVQAIDAAPDAVERKPDKVAVLAQAAGIWEEKVSDFDRAAHAYERVLSLEPSNLGASVQLEQIYRNVGNWEKLIELLLQRTEFVKDAQQRIELFQSVAQTYEKQMDDREGAFVVLQAAFKEDFSNEATARELERIATATNKWTDLVGDYTQVVQTITDAKVAADLWVKIGRWYGEHLGHIDYAIASEQQALKLEPNHKEALATLAVFFRKASRWKELAEVLGKHAAIEEEPQKRVELFLALADLYVGPLSDTQLAIKAYRDAVAADPACVDALSALERLYRHAGNWPELIDVLGRKAKVVEDSDEVIAIKHQIGGLHEEKLQDPQKAIATFLEIRNADSQNVAALKSLERLYEKTGAMEQYLEVLQQQLDVTNSDNDRIAIYERMAVTQEEKFRRPDRASEMLEKILEIDERNAKTLTTLERLYRQERRFTDLVETLRRHINATDDPTGPSGRVELYSQMGEVYENDIKDNERAIESYNDILSFDADHTGALSALGRLYERIEDWDRAIDAMGRVVQLTDDRGVQVELNNRIGRLYEERLNDAATAEMRYAEALEIDGSYVPAMVSLIALYKQRGDWLKAVQMMVRAEAFTTNPVDKVRLLHESGMIFKERLDDEARAAEMFSHVLELDPEHVESAEPLAEMLFRESEEASQRSSSGSTSGDVHWQQLEPVLDMLVRKVDKRNKAELNLLYYRSARTADALRNTEKAIKNYKLANDTDPTYLPTLTGRAELLFRQEDWDGAFKLYQTILVHHRDSRSNDEIVDIFYRLGQIKLKQNEKNKALNMFEKALEIDSAHRPTLTAVIAIQTAQNDFEAVVNAKRALMPVADDEERFRLYQEIGDLYRSKIKQPAKALEAYHEALSIKPDDHAVLQNVLELYFETKKWQEAVEVLQRFASIEKRPVARGKYFEAAAKILRDEVKNSEEAIEYFNNALDAFFEVPSQLTATNVPTYLKAFEAVDRMCTGAKDWKNQERNYRRMIKRLPADGLDSIKIALWHALGEIYRSRLREFGAAASAFEVAAKLDPTNAQRHEILAELYVMAGPDHSSKAIGEHMFLLKQDPFRIDSYRALRKLYSDLRQYDRAWCMCSALVFLQRADEEEAAFYEQYRPKGMVWARQPITDEMWNKSLMHPDEDRYVGAIFASIWQAVALQRSAEHKQFGLKRKDKLDIATHQAMFSKLFLKTAQVLNVALPEVYLRPEQPGGMQLANCQEKRILIPSVVVGAELLQGRSDKELAFPIAQFLTQMRPEHYLKRTVQTNAELRVLFLAAVKVSVGQAPVQGAEAAAVDQWVQYLRTAVPPAQLEQLGMVVQRFIASKGEINLNKWSQAVDLTAHRAGFVIINDLSLSARFIQMEPTVVGGLEPKAKIKELVMYAISESYFELRQQLGITIG